jgi:hypothetical protein
MPVFRSSRRTIRRRSVAITATVTALSLGVAAFAYFTQAGSGRGEASVATVDRQVRVIGPENVMLRIGVPTPLGGTLTTRSTVPVAVERIEVRVRQIERDGVAVPAAECSRADFVVVPAQPATAFPVSARVGRVLGTGTWTGASVMLVDDPDRSQDGCRGVTLRLHYRIEAAERS